MPKYYLKHTLSYARNAEVINKVDIKGIKTEVVNTEHFVSPPNLFSNLTVNPSENIDKHDKNIAIWSFEFIGGIIDINPTTTMEIINNEDIPDSESCIPLLLRSMADYLATFYKKSIFIREIWSSNPSDLESIRKEFLNILQSSNITISSNSDIEKILPQIIESIDVNVKIDYTGLIDCIDNEYN